ncbi:hypothetical protein [Marinobacter salsuginis]|uniref:hypothetical protein n=1 Tax=Marinobacter salsuginis TaxID=418719 RepID=UPI00273D9C55|nr:hypothetical protein [Marinobacter salsuginis]
MEFLEKFLEESYREFEALADTVWKLNSSIDDLYEEEKAKLTAYFPNDPELQAMRWSHEGYILDQVIPKALNYSLIVFLYIELETRLMKLCNYLCENRKLPVKPNELKGQGVIRYLKYIESFFNISIDEVAEIEDVRSLGHLRNCIVHTNGFVNHSSNSKAINHIVNQGRYLTRDRKDLRSGERALIKLEETEDGERLKFDFHYPFMLCGYLQRFIISLVRIIVND